MNKSVFKTRVAPLRHLFVASAVAALAACGGGSGDAAPGGTRLSGTAAVGAPIAGGAVEVRCVGGDLLQTLTKSDGTWQVDTTGETLPCGLRVTGGTLATGQALHSVALAFANVNITPLTDLMVANALGQLPDAWWGSDGPVDFSSVTDPTFAQALMQLRSAFALPALQTVDPLTTPFKALPKEPLDDVLEALRLALASLGTDYTALVNAASNAAFTLTDGFRIALGDSYRTVTVGGSGGGDAGPGTLMINVVAMGVSAPPVTLTNVPKPSTQAEFCSDLTNPNSASSLNQQIPAGQGSLTIHSCSFSGNRGNISATLNITSPAMTVPYEVTYTYN